MIFAFYEFLSRNGYASVAVAQFVDEASAPVPLHLAQMTGRVKRSLRLRFGKEASQRFMRPTPSEEQADLVCNALLKAGSSHNEVRNWLLARTAFETGMRAQGMQQLSISTLNQMLRSDAVIGPTASVLDGEKSAPFRASVRERLDQLEHVGRRNLEAIKIREKGKVRTVAVPLGLARQWVDFVWGERARHVARALTPTRSRAFLPTALWISGKTGDALSTKAIGDILGDGFQAANVPGSGHRLRAAFAVRLIREFIREDAITNWNNLYAEAILDRVAQRMGHNDPSTLRPYLHAVVLELFYTGPGEGGMT